MQVQLFNGNPSRFLDLARLREAARIEVTTSPLIVRAASGNKAAAMALHIGFWGFVREFELAIDTHAYPYRPLMKRYGTENFLDTFKAIKAAVAEMKEEEGSHAAHWFKDAQNLGLEGLEDVESERPAGVQALIDRAYDQNMMRYFSTLGGTEFIAEELSRFLTGSPDYVAQFERGRWVWGEVHLIPHDDGPSHLEIDADLALAYSDKEPAEASTEVEEAMLETIRLFGAAARDVEAKLCPMTVLA